MVPSFGLEVFIGLFASDFFLKKKVVIFFKYSDFYLCLKAMNFKCFMLKCPHFANIWYDKPAISVIQEVEAGETQVQGHPGFA